MGIWFCLWPRGVQRPALTSSYLLAHAKSKCLGFILYLFIAVSTCVTQLAFAYNAVGMKNIVASSM